MATGPGKYNAAAKAAQKSTAADGLVMIVVNGNQGQGFEVLATPQILAVLPSMLRNVADGIEAGLG